MKFLKLGSLVLGMLWVTLAMVGLAPGVSWGAPGTGLLGTDHDFTQGEASEMNTQTVGLCTFCHTPHKALNTLLLWNHTLSTNTFTWDVPATTAGTQFATFKGDTYKGPTAKCLSCHDGSVAIGDVAWFNAAARTGANALNPMTHGEGDKHNVGFGGSMAGNHPVAMPFPLQNAKNTYNGVTTGDSIILGEWEANPQTNGIRLFNDDGTGTITAGANGGKTGIECSSCHDPHNGVNIVKDDYFLRGTLTGNAGGSGGYICLLCHKK